MGFKKKKKKILILDGFSKCLQQSSFELYPSWKKTNKEDSQADATAAGKQTHSSHKTSHTRNTRSYTRTHTNSQTLSEEEKKTGKGKAVALLT